MDNDKPTQTAKEKTKQKYKHNDKAVSTANKLLDDHMNRIQNKSLNQPFCTIRAVIGKIDELTDAGSSLGKIFEVLNGGLRLGISRSSFVQYVKAARRESGSKHYKLRAKNKTKTEARVDSEQDTDTKGE